MSDMPKKNAMETPKENGLSGLDPAELLKQGGCADTFTENESGGFIPPSLEELSEIFPRFEILELIGKGGMGAVYKVRQPELERVVALKILPPAIGLSPAFASRFTREAKALAKLSHPGIVTIHESGQEGGLYYILMEYVDGVNLRQLLNNGRISPREAMAIVPQICDALQFAHDQGIVHRDIKPENLLLDRLGRVKVADFGIAKLVGSEDSGALSKYSVEATLTDGGKAMGTPQYMAPEQTASPTEVDHRADIFALGVVFYQMLTGELPEKDLQAPSKKVRIDVRLDEVVLRALEKDPSLRFSNATEMRTGIEGIDDAPKPPELPPARTPQPQPARTGKSTTFKILAVLGVLLLLCVIAVPIIGAVWFFSDSTPRRVSVETPGESLRTAELSSQMISAVSSEDGVFEVARFFPENEISIIDLLGRRVTPLGDRLLEEAELPDFSVAYHGVTDTDGATDQPMETRHFLNSRAESFSISAAPIGPLKRIPDQTMEWEVIPKDPYGTASISMNERLGLWYGFRIVSAKGRTAYGSFKLSPDESPAFRWTFLGGSVRDETAEREKAEDLMKQAKRASLLALVDQVRSKLGDQHPEALRLQERLQTLEKEPTGSDTTAHEILLMADGNFLLDGVPGSDEEIIRRVAQAHEADPDVHVLLRADRDLQYIKVRQWIEKLSATGISKINIASAGLTIEETPPVLRRLDWQDQVEAGTGEAWLPSGKIDESKVWLPPITEVNNSRIDATETNPRFLCLWFSHPLIDKQTMASVRLFQEDGKTPLDIPTGRFSMRHIPKSDETGGTGWITATVCAGTRTEFPDQAVVSLRYGLGKWDLVNEISANYRETKATGKWRMIYEPGQDSDGNAFIQITSEAPAETKDIQFDFVAITKEGRRMASIRLTTLSTGDPSFQRFTFPIPLADLRSFECHTRPIREQKWPVVLRNDITPAETMELEFDRAGDTMQEIISRLRRDYGMRICFENLAFDPETDATTLGARISRLQGIEKERALTEKETELLRHAIRLREESGLKDETLIDVGDRFEGVIKATGIEDLLEQLTNGTRYRWDVADDGKTWMVLPAENSLTGYPVSLDTVNLSVMQAVEKIISQSPEGAKIELGENVSNGPVAPAGIDPMPYRNVRCAPRKFEGIPAREVLCEITADAVPDSLWEISGYKGNAIIGISPGSGIAHKLVSDTQVWLLSMDRGEYGKGWEASSELVKEKLTQGEWTKAMGGARTPLGEVKSRKLIAATHTENLPGGPDGKYFLLQFDTTFAKKENAEEMVTLVKEKDGNWRVAGYFIK